MLYVEIGNVTPGLEQNGRSNYIARVRLNEKVIWAGYVTDHIRSEGAAKLLRLIADKMEEKKDG